VGEALVIFDCDGVLVDSEAVSTPILAAMLRDLGLDYTPERCYERFTGLSNETFRRLVADELGHELPEDFARRYRVRVSDAFRRELRTTPGVADALDRMPVARCVASSASVAKVRLTLSITGLLDRFEPHIFGAEHVARGKPHPDVFRHAARALGRRPSACVGVEDSVPGVIACRAAGIPVAGYAATADADALERARAIVFDDMAVLPELVERLLTLSFSEH
jgi:HAD superfamily hydrolase (TIGR01509 family)